MLPLLISCSIVPVLQDTHGQLQIYAALCGPMQNLSPISRVHPVVTNLKYTILVCAAGRASTAAGAYSGRRDSARGVSPAANSSPAARAPQVEGGRRGAGSRFHWWLARGFVLLAFAEGAAEWCRWLQIFDEAR
jgi:hypothetical protein